MTLLLRHNGDAPVPVEIEFKNRWANNIYLTLRAGGISQEIAGNRREMYHTLIRLARECLPQPVGILREEREPRQFRLASDLTLADLDPALPPTQLKAMLIEHFNALGLHDIAEAVMEDYKAATGKGYKPAGNDSDPQLARDLDLVGPLIDELLDEEGELVYGGQARIAEALGIPNAGGYRARVLAVRDALLEKEAA